MTALIITALACLCADAVLGVLAAGLCRMAQDADDYDGRAFPDPGLSDFDGDGRP